MLRFMDGFDDYAAATDLQYQWTLWNVGAFASPALIGGRYGGLAYSTNNFYNYGAVISSTSNTIIVGCNFSTGTGGTWLAISDYAYGASAIHVYISYSAGVFYVYQGGTNAFLGKSRTYPVGWSHVQVKVKLGSGDGELYLRVNGNDDLSLTGINTRNPNYPSSSKLDFVMCYGNNNYFDDFFIFDNLGAYNNDIIRDGEPCVAMLMPSSDGDLKEWQASTGAYNYALVDEIPPNGDTDYNSAIAQGTRDVFHATLPLTEGVAYGAQTRTNVRQLSAVTPRVMSGIVKSYGDGNVYTLGFANIGSSSYTWTQNGISNYDPGTNANWTVSGIINAQFGYKLTV